MKGTIVVAENMSGSIKRKEKGERERGERGVPEAEETVSSVCLVKNSTTDSVATRWSFFAPVRKKN